VVLASTASNVVLFPRFGSRRLIVGGLLLAFVGLALLTRLTPHSGSAANVLPSLVIIGLGFGAVCPPPPGTPSAPSPSPSPPVSEGDDNCSSRVRADTIAIDGSVTYRSLGVIGGGLVE
jgi:hypothetical protein